MEAGKIKRHKSKSHITICNDIMKERELTLKAKGLFSMIMSLPEDWVFTIKGICSIIKEQNGAVSAAIHELMDAGYCSREEVRDNGKYVGYNYSFYDKKQKSPKSENPNSGNPKSGKAKQYNNSSTNTPIIELNEDDNKDEKLSNDNQKDDLSFEHFYKLYPQKKSRKNAEKAWARLSDEDKKAAIERLPAYIADCFSHKRTYQHPATYLNGGTWTDVFDSDGEEELTEENVPTILPPGMTKEQWEKITKWMVVNIKHIAGKITPMMLYQMKKEVKGNSQLLNDILCDLDYRLMDICNYDIFEEFCKLLKTDEYQQEL